VCDGWYLCTVCTHPVQTGVTHCVQQCTRPYHGTQLCTRPTISHWVPRISGDTESDTAVLVDYPRGQGWFRIMVCRGGLPGILVWDLVT
jgi:hypothetical protein